MATMYRFRFIASSYLFCLGHVLNLTCPLEIGNTKLQFPELPDSHKGFIYLGLPEFASSQILQKMSLLKYSKI